MAFLLVSPAFGQGNQGLITFEQKINLHRRIPAENEDLKSRMPEFQTTLHELLFKENESLFRPLEEEEDAPMSGPGNGGMIMRFRRPETIIYRNHDAEYQLAQRSLFEKKYLVEDTLRIAPWKLGMESKEILGYPCLKATLETETKRDTQWIRTRVTAWFTQDIFSPFGPDTYGGLPGMILLLDINEGETVYSATRIDPSADLGDLKAPVKGEKISGTQFKALMEERMKEFQRNGRGPGQRMIRMN